LGATSLAAVAIIAASIARVDLSHVICGLRRLFLHRFAPDLVRFHRDDSLHLRYATAYLWSQKQP